VTADIARRAYEHREGLYPGFTKRYALVRLVWFEFHEDIIAAIQRESNMKHWPRAWKVLAAPLSRPEQVTASLSWMAGTSPAMTARPGYL
jgi:putative endonuclease